MPKNSPDAIDIAIGARVRILRLAAHMSQTDLGRHLGVSFQQVQKYEKGVNRIAGGNLHKVAEVLGTSVANLIDRSANDTQVFGADMVIRMLGSPSGMALAEAWLAIENSTDRAALLRVVQAMGRQS